jgi:hypothetical protein
MEDIAIEINLSVTFFRSFVLIAFFSAILKHVRAETESFQLLFVLSTISFAPQCYVIVLRSQL